MLKSQVTLRVQFPNTYIGTCVLVPVPVARVLGKYMITKYLGLQGKGSLLIGKDPTLGMNLQASPNTISTELRSLRS